MEFCGSAAELAAAEMSAAMLDGTPFHGALRGRFCECAEGDSWWDDGDSWCTFGMMFGWPPAMPAPPGMRGACGSGRGGR